MVQQKNILQSLFLSLFALLFISCHQNRPDPAEKFNDKTPGRKVAEVYSNKSPQIVYFYEVKEGKTTNNKVGEMYYYQDKKVFAGGGIKNNKKEGAWKAYHPNGKVQTDAFYIDGKEDGEYIVYHLNGKVYYSGHYQQGNCTGEWKFFDEKGKLLKTMKAEGSTIVCGACERCNKINQNIK